MLLLLLSLVPWETVCHARGQEKRWKEEYFKRKTWAVIASNSALVGRLSLKKLKKGKPSKTPLEATWEFDGSRLEHGQKTCPYDWGVQQEVAEEIVGSRISWFHGSVHHNCTNAHGPNAQAAQRPLAEWQATKRPSFKFEPNNQMTWLLMLPFFQKIRVKIHFTPLSWTFFSILPQMFKN